MSASAELYFNNLDKQIRRFSPDSQLARIDVELVRFEVAAAGVSHWMKKRHGWPPHPFDLHEIGLIMQGLRQRRKNLRSE